MKEYVILILAFVNSLTIPALIVTLAVLSQHFGSFLLSSAH